MFKLFSIFFILFSLVACGGGSSNNANNSNEIPLVIIKKTSVFLETYFNQQWHINVDKSFYALNSIDSNASINRGDTFKNYRAKGIKIAIIDDGLDVTHEDLIGSIFGTYDLATKGTDVSHSISSEFHGTAVTGIIAANINGIGIAGIASEAQIYFLKFQETMSDSDTIELFNKAEEFGADIISNSWGTYNVSQAVRSKIVDLANNGRNGKGTIIVFSSGNDDRNIANDESSIPEVISVGATDKDNLRAFYSNFGTNLDIVAPGGYYLGVPTLDDMGSLGTASVEENYILYKDSNKFIGTSASAPIVSGVIALMLEKNPNLTRVEVENILKSSADKVGFVNYVIGRNNYYGYGKINLVNIMKSI